MKHLVLIGGGHAHVAVLRALAKQPRSNLRLSLITPHLSQTYSGMLPGWLAGHYSLEDCQINLSPLVLAAQGELILDQVNGLNADQQILTTTSGRVIPYDLVSINIGSETALPQTINSQLLPIRPLDQFIQAWPRILLAAQQPNYQLAVLGGGAAGVELALAMQYAFQQQSSPAQVHLIAPKLLADHSTSVQKRVYRHIMQAGIQLHSTRAQVSDNDLVLESGALLQVHQIIAATGAKPAPWLVNSGLQLDPQGYIAVNAQQQSCSHSNVFAAGDICTRDNPHFARSGVHAVYAGQALAHNLPAYLQQQALINYHPKKRSLYLLATGSKKAIASWGGFSASGAWVWHWKNYIDQNFMRQYRLDTTALTTSEQHL